MLTTAEVAARLGISPARVRQLITTGVLTAQHHGRDWMIDARSLPRAERRRHAGWPKGKVRR